MKIAQSVQWPQQDLPKPKIVFSRIATTDIFPPDQYSTQQIVKSHGAAAEMVGFAVMAVSQIFHVPCLIVRSISDNPTIALLKNYHGSHYDIKRSNKSIAEDNAAQYVMLLVKRL